MAVSGLEMCQNSARLSWSKEEVDDKLHTIMVRFARWGPGFRGHHRTAHGLPCRALPSTDGASALK